MLAFVPFINDPFDLADPVIRVAFKPMWHKAVLCIGCLLKEKSAYFLALHMHMKANVPAVCEVAVLDRLRKPW